jgi:NADH:ubiquinone oxidoreductase subunit F (NADH-binding)
MSNQVRGAAQRTGGVLPLAFHPSSVPNARVALPLRPKQMLDPYGAHVNRYGVIQLVRSRRPVQEIASLAERWNIRGRGGAGFPFATKLQAVSRAAARTRRAVVIGNGSESEPLSFKDRALLWENPHLVLDGLELASIALHTKDVYLAIHENPILADYLRAAIADRAEVTGGRSIEVVEVPERYVAGQETAVINAIERGKALPRFQPPRPTTKGLGGRPTLVSNVETLARLAIAHHIEVSGGGQVHGAHTMGVLGTLWTPQGGSAFEAQPSETLRHVFARAAGGITEESTLIVGGYYGSFVTYDAKLAETPIGQLGARDLSCGAGLLVAFPPDACVVNEADRVISYLGGQSAGQCGPCMFGLPAIANEFHQLAIGQGGDLDKIWRWTEQIKGRGACTMPDGYSMLVRSVIRSRMAELKAHAHRGCRAKDYRVMAAAMAAKNPDSRRGLLTHVNH